MKNLNSSLHLIVTRLSVVSAVVLSMSSCIDNEFQLNDISGEITIGQDNITTIPLGFLQTKTLGEILGDDIDVLSTDANGNFSISYSGGDSFDVNGIVSSFNLARSTASTSIKYPDLNITDRTQKIDKTFTLAIPDYLQTTNKLPAQFTASIKDYGEFEYDLKLDIPEQVKSVNKIVLDGDKGAKLDIQLSLNGLAPINGGGTATVVFVVPDGYEILDSTGNAISGTSYTSTKTLASGTSVTTFTMYIHSIEPGAVSIVNGTFSTTNKMSYSVQYDFTAKSGVTFDTSKAPSLAIYSDMEYGDANVTVNEISLDDGTHALNESIRVDNVINEIANVTEVSFKDTYLPLRIDGLSWLGDNVTDAVVTKIVFPDVLSIDEDTDGYDAKSRTLSTTLSQLQKGIKLHLQALHIDENQGKPTNGSLTVDFPIEVNVGSIPQGKSFDISELVHSGDTSITISIDETVVNIDGIVCSVDYKRTETATIDLSDIADYNIEVSNFDVSPRITLDVNNPLGVPFIAAVKLIPIIDGVANDSNSVLVENVPIEAATRTDGVVKDGISHIVIANADCMDEFKDATCFKVADITKLFNGVIPQKINVVLDITSDTSAKHTLYSNDGYSLTYDYSIDIPFNFGGNFNISYSDSVDGLTDTFSGISDKNIYVGNIVIIAEVDNSTPLDMKVSAEFIDINGEPTGAQAVVDMDNNTSHGSTDGSICTSEIRIAIDLGEGHNLKSLSNVDGLKFSLNASSSQDGIKLNKEQSLSAKIKLQIIGGITTDINEL